MKFLKKWGIIIVTIFFVVAMVIMALLFAKSAGKYKSDIASLNSTIADLESSLVDIGSLDTGYILQENARVNTLITEDNVDELFQAISITDKMTENWNVVTSKNDLIGKYFRNNLNAGTLVFKENLVDKKIENSERNYQLVVDDLPTNINVGDVIDIRIKFPFGEDFIGISYKEILELDLSNGIVTVNLKEDEIERYNSMLFDRAIYPAASIYILKYTDPSGQAPAEVYYPLNTNINDILEINPNILEDVKDEMVLERQYLNELIGGSVDTLTEKELAKLQTQISTLNRGTSRSLQQALKSRIKAEAEAAKAAAKAAAKGN